jgi:phosphoribosylformylglycinamidine cyclo-ligase
MASGGFCSLYRLPSDSKQLIVSSTDGVGTKLLLAQKLASLGHLEVIGIDLVAMVVNDILTCGAQTLFLLDYYAVSNLKSDEKEKFNRAGQIIRGIAAGCKVAGCALIGGETSEMPDMYDENKFDIVGFGVGIINEDDLLGPHLVKSGDEIIGLNSSGPHSNGFSLIRHAYRTFDWLEDNDSTSGRLLAPTKIYVKVIQKLLKKPDHGIHALAHITGGGLEHNVSRVVPKNLSAIIDWQSWERPDIFNEIQQRARMEEGEMREVFNCGIGFTLIVDPSQTQDILLTLNQMGYQPNVIGVIK